MEGNIFRNRIISKIKGAMAEYEEATLLSHEGLKGRVREIAVQNLFDPLLSPDFKIGTGTIIDARGRESGETDVVIYSDRLLSPILYGDRFGTFPVDACLATVEVKSELNATTLDEALTSSRKMPQLRYTSRVYDPEAKQWRVAVVTRTLFAFRSDLKVKDELKRYIEHDSGWATCPLVKSICVVGKGTWAFRTPRKEDETGEWVCEQATSEYDEVISFLTAIIDQLVLVYTGRGCPRLRNYLNRPGIEPNPVPAPSCSCSPQCEG